MISSKAISPIVVSTLLVTAAFSRTTLGQEASAPPVQTKIETALNTKDRLLRKDFFPLGVLVGAGIRAEFDAVILADAGTNLGVAKGMRVEVTATGRLERSSTSFLDAEEVADLMKALATIGETASKWTTDPPKETTFPGGVVAAAPYRELEFSTRGDFRFGIFQQQSGKLGAALQSGRVGRVSVPLEMKDVDRLKEIVQQGSAILK